RGPRRVHGGAGARLAPRRPGRHGARRRTGQGRAPRAGPGGSRPRARHRRARPSERLVPVIVLSERDVRRLLDMESCIEAMTEVLTSLAHGELYQPLRSIPRPPGADNLLGLMPSYRGGSAPAFGLKEIGVVPTNPSRGLDTHMGGVLLHDGETGELVAILKASPVTEIRTAAVSAGANTRPRT